MKSAASRSASAISLIGVLAAGSCPPSAPVPALVPNYCAIASPKPLADGCPFGVAPSIGPDGWPLCSALTERDARAIAGEILKFQRECASAS